MKFYQIILFVSLFLYIYSDGEPTGTETGDSSQKVCNGKVSANSVNDCKGLKNSDPYCCFVKGTLAGQSTKTCIPLEKDEYDNIKDFIKKTEKEQNADIDKLDCKSIYLELSILCIILLLL